MKLYFSPGASSLAAHIALCESGLTFQPVAAPTKTKKLDDGSDYYDINPLGYVPLLELDDGTRLAEVPAILQYIADQVPAKHLAPANGTASRYRLQGWLTFIGMELHRSFSPLFNPALTDDAKTVFRDRLMGRLRWTEHEFAHKTFLMGESFTVADAYLFTVTNWAPRTGVDLTGFDRLNAFRTRVLARPAVQQAMKAEGLS